MITEEEYLSGRRAARARGNDSGEVLREFLSAALVGAGFGLAVVLLTIYAAQVDDLFYSICKWIWL